MCKTLRGFDFLSVSKAMMTEKVRNTLPQPSTHSPSIRIERLDNVRPANKWRKILYNHFLLHLSLSNKDEFSRLSISMTPLQI